MSRSGYSDDCDGPGLYLWRGAVLSAIRGKRGQSLLKEMATALDAMPLKRLIAGELVTEYGDVCVLGAVACHKGIKVDGIDPEDRERVSKTFNIAEAMAAEIVYENDEGAFHPESPEGRWRRMRKWVDENLKKEVSS